VVLRRPATKSFDNVLKAELATSNKSPSTTQNNNSSLLKSTSLYYLSNHHNPTTITMTVSLASEPFFQAVEVSCLMF